MRITWLALLALTAGGVNAAKPDPAVYPNANTYREPGITAATGYAKVIREYCPGGGRGLIHFLNVDGNPIRIRKTWPTYLELRPGHHEFEMEFMGTASSIWGTWQGTGKVEADLQAGMTYIVRYLRTATDSFRVWVEGYDGFDAVDMHTVFCAQPEFADKRLHQ